MELDPQELASITKWHDSFLKTWSLPDVVRYTNLTAGDGVIDVGANVGVFIEKIRKACPECAIAAFECVPPYARFMRDRFRDDLLTKIWPVGLSEKEAVMTLYTDPGNRGWNTLVKKMRTQGMVPIEARFLTLDSIPRGDLPERIKAIKIDTEGAEWRVLEGAKQFLLSLPNPKPYLFVEVAWGTRHPEWAREKAAFEWLFQNGWKRFEVKEVDGTAEYVFEPLFIG